MKCAQGAFAVFTIWALFSVNQHGYTQSLQELYQKKEATIDSQREQCRKKMLEWYNNTTYGTKRVIYNRVYIPIGDGTGNHNTNGGGTTCNLEDLGPYGTVFTNKDGRSEQWMFKDGDKYLCQYTTQHDGSIDENCYDRIYPGQV